MVTSAKQGEKEETQIAGLPDLGCATIKPPQMENLEATLTVLKSLPQFPLAETQQAPPLSTGRQSHDLVPAPGGGTAQVWTGVGWAQVTAAGRHHRIETVRFVMLCDTIIKSTVRIDVRLGLGMTH